MKFITLEEVMTIHELMIQIGGGRIDVHDFTLLHSAVERPRARFAGEYLYKSIWEMAAALMHSLVKNHPFDDGNKRTAYFSTIRLLRKNGYKLVVEDKEAINFMVDVDVKNPTLETIAGWLKSHTKKAT